jgi:hypothetical protein
MSVLLVFNLSHSLKQLLCFQDGLGAQHRAPAKSDRWTVYKMFYLEIPFTTEHPSSAQGFIRIKTLSPPM